MSKIKKVYNSLGLSVPQPIEINLTNEEIKEQIDKKEDSIKKYVFEDLVFYAEKDNLEKLKEVDNAEYAGIESSYNDNNEIYKSMALSSSKIEGEDYSDKGIKELQKLKKDLKSSNEEIDKEIVRREEGLKAHMDAFRLIMIFNQLGKGIVHDIYNIMTNHGDLLEEGNRLEKDSLYRQKPVGVYDPLGNLVIQGLQAEKISDSMNSLLKMMNSLSLSFDSMTEAITVIHLAFETIHPYYDYNGRMGRLFITWLFHLNGLLPLGDTFIKLLMLEKNFYYKALLDSQKTRNVMYFGAFVKYIFTKAINIENIKQAMFMNKMSRNDITWIIDFYLAGMDKEFVGYSQLKERVDTSRKAFYDKVQKFVDKNILEVEEKKTKTYRFSKEFLKLTGIKNK